MHEEVTPSVQIVTGVTVVLGSLVTAGMHLGLQTGVEEAFETVVHMTEVTEGHSVLEMTEDMMSPFLIELVAKDHILLQTDL